MSRAATGLLHARRPATSLRGCDWQKRKTGRRLGSIMGQTSVVVFAATLCPDTISEAANYAEGGLDRFGNDANLCFAFLRRCGVAAMTKVSP